MRHIQILVVSLAMAGLAAPFPVIARDNPVVTVAPKDRAVRSVWSPWIKDPVNEAGVRPGLAAAPFRFHLLVGAATVKSRSFVHDWGNGSLSLNTIRAKSARRGNGIQPFNFNRFSTWNADAELVQDIDSHESLSLGASYVHERRRPSFSVAAHNTYKTNNLAVTLGWTHDDSFRMDVSVFSSMLNRTRSTAERVVELAGGAPFATSGLALTAGFSAARNPEKLSFGVDLRRQHLAQSDAGLIGTSSGRDEARARLFVRSSF